MLKGNWSREKDLKHYGKRKKISSFEVCTPKEILFGVYLLQVKAIYYCSKVTTMSQTNNFFYMKLNVLLIQVKDIKYMKKQNKSQVSNKS